MRPTISLPKTKTYDSDDEKRNNNNQRTMLQQQSKGNDVNNKTQLTKQNKNDGKDNKSGQGSQNSGWIGGIWNKLLLKPKNQMILPDDKNPTIVWDAAKKRWINTDGDDGNSEEHIKPPPKMNDLMLSQHQQQQQQQQPLQQYAPQQQQQQHQQLQQNMPHILQQQNVAMTSTQTLPLAPSAASLKTPTLQSNKFKMQRNRTLKNSYVDVFNPSGAPMSNAADNIMAPAVPIVTMPQTGFYNPIETQQNNNNNNMGEQQQQQQQQSLANFYNPHQFGNNAGVGFN